MLNAAAPKSSLPTNEFFQSDRSPDKYNHFIHNELIGLSIIFILIILDRYGTRVNNWAVPRFGTLAGSFRARAMKSKMTTSKASEMKTSHIILSALVAGCVTMATTPLANASGGTGTDHGYFWSLYYNGGSASISFPSAGTYPGNYAITWSGVQDVVGGKGWSTGSSHSIGYNCGSISGFNNFSIYGWTTSPLIEYYVCEMGSVVNGTRVNTVSSDGHTYTFYKHQQQGQPSIQGTCTFWQYLDQWGGSSTGSNHSVTTANHITNWRNNGGQGFGNYNYQILGTEAYGGRSGSVNATVWGL